MPPCVLVLGGSGFLGQYVVDALTKDGEYNVMILSKAATQAGNHRSPAAPPPLAATNANAPVVDRVVVGSENESDEMLSSPCPSTASHASSAHSRRRRGHVRYVYGNLATGEGLYDALVAAAKFGGDRDIDADSHDSDFEEKIKRNKRTFNREGLEDLCPDCKAFHDDVDEEDEEKRRNRPDFDDDDETDQTAEENGAKSQRSVTMFNSPRETGGVGTRRLGDPAFDGTIRKPSDFQTMKRFTGLSKSNFVWGKCQHRKNRRYPGLAAVVNCAAVSSPAECERDPELSRSINVPEKLVRAMREFGKGPFLVHLSTDQIYSGERSVHDPFDHDEKYFDVTYHTDGEEEEATDDETGEKVTRKREKSRVAHSLWSEREVARVGSAPVGSRKRYEPFEPFYSAEKKNEDERKETSDDDDEQDLDDSFGPDPRSEGGAGILQTAFWRTPESSPDIDPINAYAKQKADAELMLSEKYPRSIFLRSSVMFGRLPRDKAAVRGTRFLQFVDEALRKSDAKSRRRKSRSSSTSADGGGEGEEEEEQACFFDDEFRSFVAVDDVAAAVVACVRKWGRPCSEDCGPPDKLFYKEDMDLPTAVNVGGPERLSRADFARLVADNRGYDKSVVRAVPASSVQRAVPSPKDISMSIDKLKDLLGIEPKSVTEALKEMPPDLE